MAKIIGGITTSHIPAIGNAIANKLWDDPYWKPFFDGYPPEVYQRLMALKAEYDPEHLFRFGFDIPPLKS